MESERLGDPFWLLTEVSDCEEAVLGSSGPLRSESVFALRKLSPIYNAVCEETRHEVHEFQSRDPPESAARFSPSTQGKPSRNLFAAILRYCLECVKYIETGV